MNLIIDDRKVEHIFDFPRGGLVPTDYIKIYSNPGNLIARNEYLTAHFRDIPKPTIFNPDHPDFKNIIRNQHENPNYLYYPPDPTPLEQAHEPRTNTRGRPSKSRTAGQRAKAAKSNLLGKHSNLIYLAYENDHDPENFREQRLKEVIVTDKKLPEDEWVESVSNTALRTDGLTTKVKASGRQGRRTGAKKASTGRKVAKPKKSGGKRRRKDRRGRPIAKAAPEDVSDGEEDLEAWPAEEEELEARPAGERPVYEGLLEFDGFSIKERLQLKNPIEMTSVGPLKLQKRKFKLKWTFRTKQVLFTKRDREINHFINLTDSGFHLFPNRLPMIDTRMRFTFPGLLKLRHNIFQSNGHRWLSGMHDYTTDKLFQNKSGYYIYCAAVLSGMCQPTITPDYSPFLITFTCAETFLPQIILKIQRLTAHRTYLSYNRNTGYFHVILLAWPLYDFAAEIMEQITSLFSSPGIDPGSVRSFYLGEKQYFPYSGEVILDKCKDLFDGELHNLESDYFYADETPEIMDYTSDYHSVHTKIELDPDSDVEAVNSVPLVGHIYDEIGPDTRISEVNPDLLKIRDLYNKGVSLEEVPQRFQLFSQDLHSLELLAKRSGKQRVVKISKPDEKNDVKQKPGAKGSKGRPKGKLKPKSSKGRRLSKKKPKSSKGRRAKTNR